MWPPYHQLKNRVSLLFQSGADSHLLWVLTVEQSGWKVAQWRQRRPSVCVCTCRCDFSTLLRAGACWNDLDSLQGGSTRSCMKQCVTSLPPPSSLFLVPHVKWRQECRKGGNSKTEWPSPCSYLAGLGYKLNTDFVVNLPFVSLLPFPGG